MDDEELVFVYLPAKMRDILSPLKRRRPEPGASPKATTAKPRPDTEPRRERHFTSPDIKYRKKPEMRHPDLMDAASAKPHLAGVTPRDYFLRKGRKRR